MISVAFVCLGNICRSPMAELVFKNIVEERGLEGSFRISSFGTSDCEEGNPIYPPAKRTLVMHGIAGNHTAKQLTRRDIVNNDFILVMDTENMNDVLRLTGGEYGGKVYKLCSFTPRPRDVADPWYTRDFARAYADIEEGCRCFLDWLIAEKPDLFSYDLKH